MKSLNNHNFILIILANFLYERGNPECQAGRDTLSHSWVSLLSLQPQAARQEGQFTHCPAQRDIMYHISKHTQIHVTGHWSFTLSVNQPSEARNHPLNNSLPDVPVVKPKISQTLLTFLTLSQFFFHYSLQNGYKI